MNKELERLQKEINGKVVTYVEGGLRMEAVLLFPPGGEVITVKQYGYTPQEIVDILEIAGYEGYSIEKVSEPSFCLASHNASLSEENDTMEALAMLPTNGIYHFADITGKDYEGVFGPECPYG